MNPLQYTTKEVDNYFLSFDKMYPKAYNKKTTNPYTKTRVILLNGTEYESVWFLHQFARHIDNDEIKRAIAVVRKQEQQQQKRIACLKPLNESILETTIAYEQLAIDLTATLAQNDVDKANIDALNFALLEDFDHLYRFSNLMMLDVKDADPKFLVGGLTEIMPARPTIAHHRYPMDNVKKAMNSKKSELYSTPIFENITWGKEDATLEEVKKAARIAQAKDFIESKEDGYFTMVLEKGMSLSGGQKQRINIARCILKDAEIIIFDDSTSALDLKTERQTSKNGE